jgi:GNAT superfamily N-acetyltransferase
MVRFSVESDKEKIIELLEICFGYRGDEGAYENIPGRYLLYFIENKLVAMIGLIYDSEFASGVEISWTCTHPEYRNQGLMGELFAYITDITDNDIYCSCWKLPEKEKINLYSLMERYNFELILHGHIKNIYPHKCSAGNTCPHFTGNGCICSQDLYVRKGCLSRSCT